ncbi:MAG: C1 family peptidase [Isosphaeraceae bacterium]|nr:C1 family peptidase [Isosphaeraceae bacterium]
MSSITIVRDLRGQFGAAREQGLRPTCLAFAASDAHAAVRDSTWSDLSCEYLFYHAIQRQGASHTAGTNIPSIRDALDQDGQPLEAGWPYLQAVPKSWKPPAKVGAVFRRASKTLAGKFGRAWQKVTAGAPVLVGMSISNSFYAPKAGVVDSTEAVDITRRHAVIAVAAGDQAGARFLMVRNSWGAGWGLAGYAWIAERYMNPRIMEMVTVN